MWKEICVCMFPGKYVHTILCQLHTESSEHKSKHLTLIPTPFCNKLNLGSEGIVASRIATRILLDHSSLEHLQGAENKNILRNKTKTPGNQVMWIYQKGTGTKWKSLPQSKLGWFKWLSGTGLEHGFKLVFMSPYWWKLMLSKKIKEVRCISSKGSIKGVDQR